MKFIILMTFLVTSQVLNGGSAIFIHPDGSGLGHWNAARLLLAGPDGDTHWDRLETLSAYRVHQKNWLSTTSHAGATVHAYGKKVHHNSFGMDRNQPINAASGSRDSIMQEAIAKGLKTAIVNSGHIAEPGTAVFVASSDSRQKSFEIAAKVMKSGVDVIFAGGEQLLLPKGEIGFFGQEGLRTDGRNLLKEAEAEGYQVIFTREELLELDSNASKVIGIFAAGHTFNDGPEEKIQRKGLPLYRQDAPSLAEMTTAALQILGSDPETEFFAVLEEEGSDNFSNKNNAAGMLEAMMRADAAIGVAVDFLQKQPQRNTLVLVTADSDAGHPTIFSPRGFSASDTLPAVGMNGAPIDGPQASPSPPFLSLPDQYGTRHPFGIAWATTDDVQGSAVAKASGYMSEEIGSSLDNTGIYKILHRVLFEE